MESLAERIIFYIYGLVIILPLIYSILFLIKAIFKPKSLPQISSFFESPFKSKIFNIIASKSILSLMLLVALFLVYFGISLFFLDKKPFPVILNITGTILFMLYYCCFTGLIYGLGKASGAGGSSKQVYKELFNIFSKYESKSTQRGVVHNKTDAPNRK